MTTQVWRVVCEGGEVKRPEVGDVGGGECVAMTGEDGDVHVGDGSTPRAAVFDLCRVAGWEAVEIVAPGAQTSEERLAQVTALLADRDAHRISADAAEADRDYWREQMTAAAPCVDEIRRLTRRVVRGGTGCALDPVLAVDTAIATLDGMMVSIERIASVRDAARASHAALAAAVRCYLAAVDEPTWDERSLVAVDAARAALDAALAVAREIGGTDAT